MVDNMIVLFGSRTGNNLFDINNTNIVDSSGTTKPESGSFLNKIYYNFTGKSKPRYLTVPDKTILAGNYYTISFNVKAPHAQNIYFGIKSASGANTFKTKRILANTDTRLVMTIKAPENDTYDQCIQLQGEMDYTLIPSCVEFKKIQLEFGTMATPLEPNNIVDLRTNGLGVMSDAISCLVTEERNGIYELVMEYPVTGKLYKDISLRSIIVTKSNPNKEPQPFRIYAITKPINGIITINAAHISYDLSGIPVEPFTADSAISALAGITDNAMPSSNAVYPFTFYTNKSTVANMAIETPCSIRALLGGSEGSILDIYGGEYEFDKYSVVLHENRGANNGVSISYGKNLTDLKQEENCSSVYTGVYPFWYSSQNGLVQLPITNDKNDRIVYADGSYNFNSIYPLDLSQDFTDPPTEQQLKDRASEYITNNKIGIPKVSLTVSFMPLFQSEDYKDYAILETVNLCDTISVYFPEMNVSSTAKCIKTVYNAISGKYDSIDIGEAKSNLAETINNQAQSIKNNITKPKSYMQTAIDNATKLITGNLGGNIAFHISETTGKPDEILVMDTEDIGTATNVWRWNTNGFGHSSSGYNGPYETAITIDGKIVADFITAGVINAGLVSLADTDGGFSVASGYSDETITTGAKMYGSGGVTGGQYIIVTNKGCRMQCDDTSMFITNDRINANCINGGFAIRSGYDGSETTKGMKIYGPAGVDGNKYIIVTNSGCRMQSGNTYFYITDSNIKASQSIATDSDIRLKNSISYDLEKFKSFFMDLKPAQYYLNTDESNTLDVGFIAQDIEKALTDNGLTNSDFSGLSIDALESPDQNGLKDSRRLRYEKFVPINTMMIQDLYSKNEELEKRIRALESLIS